MKNHFYSTFRKSVRHINKFIRQYCRRFKMKSISNRALLNILSASEEVRLHRDELSPETIHRCEGIYDPLNSEIKVCLIKYSSETTTFDKGDLVDLINQILAVNKSIKHQKNQHTENIISTIGRRAGLLASPDYHTAPQKPAPVPQPPSQLFLLAPFCLQEMGLPMISVSSSGTQGLLPTQPAFYPMQPAQGPAYPQLVYCLLATCPEQSC